MRTHENDALPKWIYMYFLKNIASIGPVSTKVNVDVEGSIFRCWIFCKRKLYASSRNLSSPGWTMIHGSQSFLRRYEDSKPASLSRVIVAWRHSRFRSVEREMNWLVSVDATFLTRADEITRAQSPRGWANTVINCGRNVFSPPPPPSLPFLYIKKRSYSSYLTISYTLQNELSGCSVTTVR